MKTAYIFHDAFCDPATDWYQWMRATLEQQGYFVVMPKFPTPAGQSYESWKSVMRNYADKFDGETIFIGHGIGGTFALRIVEEISVQIHGLFLVASYVEPLGHVGYDRVNETFIKHTFDWEKIKNNVLTTKVFAGQNDPFVPEALTNNLAQFLGTDVVTIPEGGHVNKASGFTQCIPLAQGIKEGLGEIDKSMVVETPERPLPANAEVPPLKEGVGSALLNPSFRGVDGEAAGALEEKKIGSEAPAGSHTMYQDMTKLVNSNEGKVATSLLGKARIDEAEKKVNQPLTQTNGLYILGTLAILLIIISIGVSLFKKYAPAQKNIPARNIPSLIQSEFHQNINIAGKQSYEVSQAITTALVQKPAPGVFHDIYYTRGTLRASFTDVLESLDLGDDIPASLVGEFIPAGITDTPVFMHGALSIDNVSGHTLILPITHYDRAFTGFREWEQTIFRDLGVFMNIPSSFLKTKISRDTFQDEMVANKTIRVLRYKKPAATTNDILAPLTPSLYQENDLMLAYFFLNDKTVIILDNLEIIPELLTRYANSQIYR